jgi:acetyl-CoA carboxylase biotin carboxyl carrier protein
MTDSSSDRDEVFNVDRIRQLIELMKSNELSQIDLRQGDQRIRLRRGSDAPVTTFFAAPSGHAAAPMQAPPVMASAAAPVASAPAEPSNLHTVKSPMVGTFYSKPNPESNAYVKVGDSVTSETVVCQIEAMKMFNEIPAGVAGKITAILVQNESPVDVNKPLFKIEPIA